MIDNGCVAVGFDPATVAGQFQVRNYTVVIAAAEQLGVDSNPSRVALSLFQPGTDIPVANASATFGASTGNVAYRLLSDLPKVMKYSDWGALLGYDWYFTAGGFPWILGVWEVIYHANATPDQGLRQGTNGDGRAWQPNTKLKSRQSRLFRKHA